MDIDKHFPMEKYREGQREVIEFAVNAFNDGKKVVLLECPTGAGKSAIAMTLAGLYGSAYYLTITKILQDQLVNDFGDKISLLKGRASYECTFWERFGESLVNRKLLSETKLIEMQYNFSNCAKGFCRTSMGGRKVWCKSCFPKNGVQKGDLESISGRYSDCPYYEDLYTAINSSKVVMNFSSFLYQTFYTERFRTRELMIIDECHNIEPELLNFVSLKIDDKYLDNEMPDFGDDIFSYIDWLEHVGYKEVILDKAKECYADDDIDTGDELVRKVKKYTEFICSIEESRDPWVCEYEKSEKSGVASVTFKPVFARGYANDLLLSYGVRSVLLSATILDVNVMCNSLGINRKHVAAYRMKSRFPVENRPIIYRPAGRFTGGQSRMKEWAPKLLKSVKEIMDEHSDERGIIHTHNFAILKYIVENIDETNKKRLFHQLDYRSKNLLLEEHAKSKNGVIIAPAMHEGVDLKDDLSRFQIIVKMPYANCFDDKQLAKRVELDRNYYNWLVAIKICQSYGRSIRSEEDYAVTYIIDSAFDNFMKYNYKMVPSWFSEALKRE